MAIKRTVLSAKYQEFIKYFEVAMPIAESELHFSNNYELLVAVILSAQCTDARVNKTTPSFFKRFPDPETLALASVDEVFLYIKSISYPNNKAKNLVGMAQRLVADFGGVVPNTVESLITLPGVGRKTANVVMAVAFDKPAMPVDTHVFRVSARIGLVRDAKNVLDTERQLVHNIPESLIPKAHHWLILHGRYICKARKPLCEQCGITHICDYFLSNKIIDK